MRTVITGGAGFIGSHLAAALGERGDAVVCIERPGASRRWIDGLAVAFEPVGVEDPRVLAERFDGADVVFHLAGLTEARRAADFYRVNTLGTENVLKAAAMHGRRAPHVVLMSSIAAVGSCRNGVPIRPDTAPFPLSHYGTSKLMAECLVHEYAERVPATIVRLPSVYGPRERAVLMLFRLVKRGLALTVGSWDREVSLIYVADVVQGLLSIGGNPIAFHRTYVLAHPEAITWRGFAACVGRALRRSPILLSVPTTAARMIAVAAEGTAALRRRAAILNRGRLREMMQARWVCDPSRALVELDFQPSYPASRGVEATARWYQEAQWL